MGISINWQDNSQSILRMEVVGKWNWLDFARSSYKVATMMRAVSHRVDVVMDMCQAASAPAQHDNQALRDAIEQMPFNHGKTVFIGADYFTEMIIKIMQGYIPRLSHRIHFVPTVDHAVAFIKDERIPTAADTA